VRLNVVERVKVRLSPVSPAEKDQADLGQCAAPESLFLFHVNDQTVTHV
jgi:hypothetical protein